MSERLLIKLYCKQSQHNNRKTNHFKAHRFQVKKQIFDHGVVILNLLFFALKIPLFFKSINIGQKILSKHW